MLQYNFDKTIIDSGTTNLRLPVKVFVKVLDLIKKQVKVSYPTLRCSTVIILNRCGWTCDSIFRSFVILCSKLQMCSHRNMLDLTKFKFT